MTSPDQSPIPSDGVGQTVGSWGFDDLIEGLTGGWEVFIRFLIAGALHALADAIGGIPIVGDALEDAIDGLANFIAGVNETANTAQASADVAYGNANAAYAAATAASTAASNAANLAAAAQETADIAYDYGTYREKEFAVTSADLRFGNNETVLGIILPVPPNSTIKLTRLVYSMKQNTGTVTVELIRRALSGTESVIHTTNIASAAITFSDNTIDYEIEDLDHFFCNITARSGTVTALHCCVEYVILPVTP